MPHSTNFDQLEQFNLLAEFVALSFDVVSNFLDESRNWKIHRLELRIGKCVNLEAEQWTLASLWVR